MKFKRELWHLEKPCENPKPDRRSKDSWEYQPEFPPGLYVCIGHLETLGLREGETKSFWSHELRKVGKEGDHSCGVVTQGAGKEKFDALMGSQLLQRVDPDAYNLRHVLALHPEMEPRHMCEVLSWLLQNGVILPEQLNVAFRKVAEIWDKEEDG